MRLSCTQHAVSSPGGWGLGMGPARCPARNRRSGAEDPRRQHGGVLRVVDADARDRHAGRHLHDREQRVEAVEDAHRRAERHADHGQVGVRGDDAREARPRGRRPRSAPAARARAPSARTRRPRPAAGGPSAPRARRRSRARPARRAPAACARGRTPSRSGSRRGARSDTGDVATIPRAGERDLLDPRVGLVARVRERRADAR